MMRDCPEGDIRDLLPLFAKGVLPPAEQAAVAAHTATCDACSAELRLLRGVARAFEVAPIRTDAIVAALPARRAARPSTPYYRQPLWRIAASLTLMISGAAAVLLINQRTPAPQDLAGAGGDSSLAPVTPGSGGAQQVAVASGVGSAAGRATGLGFGVSLSDLTDAQLEALLTTIERIEGTVSADPEIMAKPIVPGGSDLEGRRN